MNILIVLFQLVRAVFLGRAIISYWKSAYAIVNFLIGPH